MSVSSFNFTWLFLLHLDLHHDHEFEYALHMRVSMSVLRFDLTTCMSMYVDIHVSVSFLEKNSTLDCLIHNTRHPSPETRAEAEPGRAHPTHCLCTTCGVVPPADRQYI